MDATPLVEDEWKQNHFQRSSWPPITNWHLKWIIRDHFFFVVVNSRLWITKPIRLWCLRLILIDHRMHCLSLSHRPTSNYLASSRAVRWRSEKDHKQAILDGAEDCVIISRSQFLAPQGYTAINCQATISFECEWKWTVEAPLCINRFAHPSSLAGRQEEPTLLLQWIFPSRLYQCFIKKSPRQMPAARYFVVAQLNLTKQSRQCRM